MKIFLIFILRYTRNLRNITYSPHWGVGSLSRKLNKQIFGCNSISEKKDEKHRTRRYDGIIMYTSDIGC